MDAAHDFVLAGGAALLAHDLITRTTGDLDLFSTTAQHIDDVAAAFVEVAGANGWPVVIVRQSATFARIEVGDPGGDGLVIDLGLARLAARIDAGFSRAGLADALGSIDRFADVDFPVDRRLTRRGPSVRATVASDAARIACIVRSAEFVGTRWAVRKPSR